MRIPLTAPNLHAVDSLSDLRAKRKENQERDQAIGVTDFWRSMMDEAVLLNDTSADYAQHDKRLIILDQTSSAPTSKGLAAYKHVSGELRLNEDDNRVESAFLEVDQTTFQYKREGDTETFIENFPGLISKVVLDHRNNTLTWEDS